MKKKLRCSLPLKLSQNKIVYVRLINDRKIKNGYWSADKYDHIG
jgi:hypothetical protein